jgi:hypothetical protein
MDDRTRSNEDSNDDDCVIPLDDHWRHAIDTAATERELMSVARNFVAGVPEAELAALPAEWRPRRLRSARDVSLMTYRLAQAYCGAQLDTHRERCMRSMLPFFQSLSQRLFAVRERAARPR